MASALRCSLCSRSYSGPELRPTPAAGHQAQPDLLCRQCWQVLTPQPWPEAGDAAMQSSTSGAGASASGAHAARQAQATAAFVAQQQRLASLPAQPRRSQSMAEFGMLAAAVGAPQAHRQQPHLQRPSARWVPASMPEAPGLLGGAGSGGFGGGGSAPDARWGALAASVSGRRGSAGGGGFGGPLSPTPPVQFSALELKNMMDEASLELFESQSHLLDSESRALLAKQRQYIEWQNSMDEAGPLASVLERQDSAGSGNEGGDCGGSAGLRAQMRALAAERDAMAVRSRELEQQLAEKKRQLFGAIQEREQLRETARGLASQLAEATRACKCRICLTAPRNVVVLPCLHFLYCDACFRAHCTASATCPACAAQVTGSQAVLV